MLMQALDSWTDHAESAGNVMPAAQQVCFFKESANGQLPVVSSSSDMTYGRE
jgi:hypothetical protein